MPYVFYEANLIQNRIWNGRAISVTLFSLFSLIVNVKDIHENMKENHGLIQIGRETWLAGFMKNPPWSKREWNLFCHSVVGKMDKEMYDGWMEITFLTTSTQ